MFVMTQEKTKREETSETTTSFPAIPNLAEPFMETVLPLNGSSVEAVSTINEALFKCGTEVLQEAAAFALQRLDNDVKAVGTLRDCRSPAELLQQQAQFGQRMARDYAEETRKLTGILTRHAEAMWTPWQSYNQAVVAAVSRTFLPK